jgi:hypothetical protein
MLSSNTLPQTDSRRAALDIRHQVAIERFEAKLQIAVEAKALNQTQFDIVLEHLIRLGERGCNAANTGNLQDLFCYTLDDTKNPIRAYAQALADSIKIVPMDEDAVLCPRLREAESNKLIKKVSDLSHYGPGDKMLIAHTMVAYGDGEISKSARAFIRATIPEASSDHIEREFARMVVQSQHGPSSTFVLARARSLTLELDELYERAGYTASVINEASEFYRVCAQFDPAWVQPFLSGFIPTTTPWARWRYDYLEHRQNLPDELIYQLSSDTLTNFLDGTLQSGKWTDASIMFGGVTEASAFPAALARIVNQYIAEHVALHDRPAEELVEAVAQPLKPWGVGFSGGRAVSMDAARIENREIIQAQFDATWARRPA